MRIDRRKLTYPAEVPAQVKSDGLVTPLQESLDHPRSDAAVAACYEELLAAARGSGREGALCHHHGRHL